MKNTKLRNSLIFNFDGLAKSRHTRGGGYPCPSNYVKRMGSRFHGNDGKTPSPTFGEGFTLLEVIIVLVIISLIMGLSALYFANALPSSKFNAAARELSATIRYARTLALIEGKFQILNIDLDAKRYGIEGRGYKNLDSGTTIIVLDPSVGDGEVRNGIYQLIFQPSGGVEGGTIVLVSGKKKISIGLDPVVGSVIVK
jgi:general secretion pathway protein H